MPRLHQVSIRNFRCLKTVDLECAGLVALIGPNGSGKSALLHALRFFFGDLSVDAEDCWGGEADRIIEVAISIAVEATDEALTPHLDENGCMWVARRSIPVEEGGRFPQYVTKRKGNPDFAKVRQQTNATAAKQIYQALDSDKYRELPPWTNFGALPGALDAWEQEHPEELSWTEDNSIGYGSGQIDLAQYIEPLFVPAVQDAASESEDARASVLRVLIERIVNPKLLFEEAARGLDDELRQRYGDMVGTGAAALASASGTISSRLERFAPGAEVKLEWEEKPPAITAPSVKARLVEGGHVADIGRQGHGVQRAYILALLHEIASGREEAVEEDSRPLLLMLIEEPELYQHPNRARLLARILGELASDERSPTQVIYATHSPHFVGLDRIDALRVLRSHSDSTHPSTDIASVDLDTMAEDLWHAAGEPGEPYTAETLVPRLRLVSQAPVADGFFADGVILVEGEEDRAFILAGASTEGLDLDAGNIAILPVGGKTNIDRPLLVFSTLGISTFVVFDGDENVRRSERKSNAKKNRALLHLLEVEPVDNPPTQVNPGWACFQNTFEQTIRDEFEGETWSSSLRDAADEAGYVGVDQARKNPLVLFDAYGRARKSGASSPTLEGIISAIRSRFSA